MPFFGWLPTHHSGGIDRVSCSTASLITLLLLDLFLW
ncbi:Uncharacterised protein [Vibrio cholerae]|nr:Uncharacterised protein [Vibrio cholerae]